MNILDLNEAQGLDIAKLEDWLLANGWQSTARGYCAFIDGLPVEILDPTEALERHCDDPQAVLMEINPRMRKGMPSLAAWEAHCADKGLWLAVWDVTAEQAGDFGWFAKRPIVTTLRRYDDTWDWGIRGVGFFHQDGKPEKTLVVLALRRPRQQGSMADERRGDAVTSQPEKSAAERAREDANRALSLDADCAIGNVTEHGWFSGSRPLFANLARHILTLTEDLSTATERAEVVREINEWLCLAGIDEGTIEARIQRVLEERCRYHNERDQATERAEKAERELATSRAAHDKLSEWVRYFCESFEANADRWSIAAWKQKVRGLYEMLPTKETT